MDDWRTRITNGMIPLAAIFPHPENPRLHPEAQLAQLQASHEEFSQYRSVVVWARPGGTFVQVAGHGIDEAMRARKVSQVRADILPEDTPEVTVRRILLADNGLPALAEDDNELLTRLLSEEQDAGRSLLTLGSDMETLRQLLEVETTRERSLELAEPEGGEMDEGYNLLVTCGSEAEQRRCYDLLEKEGFQCKPLTL